MNRLKKGFTIVEMLMVIAVLAVLVGIVTTAATSAVRQSRDRRKDAMRQVLQNGIAVYYQQKGEWPTSKLEGMNGTEDELVCLSYDDSQDVFRAIVKESVSESTANPFVDVSGLFVAEKGNFEPWYEYKEGAETAKGHRGSGRNFKEATQTTAHSKKLLLNQMAFGYADKETGYFRPYYVLYNTRADSVEVITNSEMLDGVNKKFKKPQ